MGHLFLFLFGKENAYNYTSKLFVEKTVSMGNPKRLPMRWPEQKDLKN
jgi:hypothetical protein